MKTDSKKTSKPAPHHLFIDSKPLCGVKGKALVAWTSATPAEHACGRCRRAAESRKIEMPGAAGLAHAEAEKILAPLDATISIPRSEIVADLPVLEPVVTPALETHIAKEGHVTEEKPAKAKRTAKPKAERKPRGKKETPKFVKIKTFLLDPEFSWTESGKVDTITGLCPECKTHKRTIHAADAFQVKRCEECQKKAIAKRVSDRRKAKRKAAKKAESK